MVIKAQSSNPTRPSKVLSKYRNALVDPFWWREKGVSDEWLQDLALEFLKYIDDNPDAIRLYTFFGEKKIPTSTIEEWRKRDTIFNEAYELAKDILSERREKDAWNKGGALTIFLKTQHLYDSKWLDINKYHSDMKKDEESQAHTYNINYTKPIVKTKEDLEKEVTPETTYFIDMKKPGVVRKDDEGKK